MYDPSYLDRISGNQINAQGMRNRLDVDGLSRGRPGQGGHNRKLPRKWGRKMDALMGMRIQDLTRRQRKLRNRRERRIGRQGDGMFIDKIPDLDLPTEPDWRDNDHISRILPVITGEFEQEESFINGNNDRMRQIRDALQNGMIPRNRYGGMATGRHRLRP